MENDVSSEAMSRSSSSGGWMRIGGVHFHAMTRRLHLISISLKFVLCNSCHLFFGLMFKRKQIRY